MNSPINKTTLSYSEWKETADTLHMYLQMAGKVKVERNDKCAEWAHVRLYLTPTGLTTGLIPGNPEPFSICFNLRKSKVLFICGDREEIIELKNGVSVADFYKQFMAALDKLGVSTAIDTKPQEVADPIDFTKDSVHHTYDEHVVKIWLDNMLFAYSGLMRFIAPFRGKIIYPSFYFGTFDLSCCVYSGESAPYGIKSAISQFAFDERLFECGFWPGDASFNTPAFYALPYPFLSSIGSNEKLLKPAKAYFKPAKKEFLFTLEDAFSYKDPIKAVNDFCESSFLISQLSEPWKEIKWITKPLDYPE